LEYSLHLLVVTGCRKYGSLLSKGSHDTKSFFRILAGARKLEREQFARSQNAEEASTTETLATQATICRLWN